MQKQTPSRVQQKGHRCRTTSSAANGRILVLHDDQIIRILATGMIEHLGFAATACSTGEEAVALYRKAKDAGLPFMAAILNLDVADGMGGNEAAVEIVATDPEARLMASSCEEEYSGIVDFRSYGFCCVVAKPFLLSDISKVLSHLANLLKVTKPQTRK